MWYCNLSQARQMGIVSLQRQWGPCGGQMVSVHAAPYQCTVPPYEPALSIYEHLVLPGGIRKHSLYPLVLHLTLDSIPHRNFVQAP